MKYRDVITGLQVNRPSPGYVDIPLKRRQMRDEKHFGPVLEPPVSPVTNHYYHPQGSLIKRYRIGNLNTKIRSFKCVITYRNCVLVEKRLWVS